MHHAVIREMMTVSSSISLQARAGFFCQVTEAGVLMPEGPPRTSHSCGRTSYSVEFGCGTAYDLKKLAVGFRFCGEEKYIGQKCAQIAIGADGHHSFSAACNSRNIPSDEHSN